MTDHERIDALLDYIIGLREGIKLMVENIDQVRIALDEIVGVGEEIDTDWLEVELAGLSMVGRIFLEPKVIGVS